jgi:hypothetical protein
MQYNNNPFYIYIYITLYLKICISSENVSAKIRYYRFFNFFYIYGLYILFFVWTIGLSDYSIPEHAQHYIARDGENSYCLELDQQFSPGCKKGHYEGKNDNRDIHVTNTKGRTI